MPTINLRPIQTINLRPIQTGDACYLTDHHNRPGECIVTLTMTDACLSSSTALVMLCDAIDNEPRIPVTRCNVPSMRGAADCAVWCINEWRAAQGDMPAAADRDNEGGDEADRYLDCHILATWEV
jgi:hypothetical protein